MNVGIDIGFGNVKLFDSKGGSIHASHLGQMRNRGTEDATSAADTLTVTFDHMEYLVGERVAIEGRGRTSTGMHRFDGTEEAKAVLYAGFSKRILTHGSYKEPIDAYVGVPFERMNGADGAENTASTQKWLLNDGKPHEWLCNGKKHTARFNSVVVRTQANGAMGDMILTLQGAYSPAAEYVQRGFGIISVGFNTVELSGALYGKPAGGMSASAELGVRAMLELYKSKKPLANMDLEYRYGLLNAKVNQWSTDLISFVNDRWKENIASIQRVWLVGGGANDSRPALQSYFCPIPVVTPDDPYIAVARGLYKWGVKNAKAA